MSEVIFSVFPSENFVDLGLYQFGWEQCDPAHSFGPAARNHYLFHFCLSGTGKLIADNGKENTYTWSKDNFYMVQTISGKIHPGYPLNSISKYKIIDRYFTDLTEEDRLLLNKDETDVIQFIAEHL